MSFPSGGSSQTSVSTSLVIKCRVFLLFTDDGRATHPTSTQEAIQQIVENFDNKGSSDSDPYADPEDSEIVREAKKANVDTLDFSYTERDVILYNLGIGATEQELQWIYESHDQFSALPTFGVIPQFAASGGMSMDFLPNFNPVCFSVDAS